MEGIVSSADTVISIFDKMWTLISGNPFTATLLAEPVLCFFASFILLASVVALFGTMVRGCRR